MNEEQAYEIMLRLTALPYFPSEAPARAVIAEAIQGMCANVEQGLWLVKRAVDLWEKWESVRDLRAIFCSKYKPADGIDISYSEVFPDGIVPSEKPAKEWQPKALPPGAVTGDKKLEDAIHNVAEGKRLHALSPAALRTLEPPRPQSPKDKPITEEDVKRAVEELHRKQQEKKP